MKSINLGLVLEDKDYAVSLADAVSLYYRNIIVTICEFDNVNNTFGKYDMILIDENSLLNITKKIEDQSGDDVFANVPLVVLTEKRKATLEQAERKGTWVEAIGKEYANIYVEDVFGKKVNLSYLYKYNDVHTIAKTIKSIYEAYSLEHMCDESIGSASLYSFAGMCGGAGTTSIALTVARCLSRFHGKKVLFLSLSKFANNDFEIGFHDRQDSNNILSNKYKDNSCGRACENIKNDLLKNNNKKGLLRYIYDLEYYGEDNISNEDYLLKDMHGVYHFESELGLNPVAILQDDELIKTIESMVLRLGFDSIIVDVGDSFSNVALEIISMSQKIFFVHRSRIDNVRKKVIERFLYQNGKLHVTKSIDSSKDSKSNWNSINGEAIIDIINFSEENFIQFDFEKRERKIIEKTSKEGKEDSINRNEIYENCEKDEDIKFVIEQNDDSFEYIDGVQRIDMDRGFGIEVSNLVNKLML